jgi:hypothetical protein
LRVGALLKFCSQRKIFCLPAKNRNFARAAIRQSDTVRVARRTLEKYAKSTLKKNSFVLLYQIKSEKYFACGAKNRQNFACGAKKTTNDKVLPCGKNLRLICFRAKKNRFFPSVLFWQFENLAT